MDGRPSALASEHGSPVRSDSLDSADALNPDIQSAFVEYVRYQGYNRTLQAFLAETATRPPQNPLTHGRLGLRSTGWARGRDHGVARAAPSVGCSPCAPMVC